MDHLQRQAATEMPSSRDAEVSLSGALPIPGAKNLKQVEELVGAVGWRLSDAEVAELDALSDKFASSTGAPFENW